MAPWQSQLEAMISCSEEELPNWASVVLKWNDDLSPFGLPRQKALLGE